MDAVEAPTWALHLGGPGGDQIASGPVEAFDALDLSVRVSVVDAAELPPPGQAVEEIEVVESGAGAFVVQHHSCGAGWQGLTHPVGGNRLAWSIDGTRVLTSRASSTALSWVHVRFVLRHLATSHLLAEAGSQVVHTVAAEADGGVMAVVGPTLSGKSRLVSRLVERRVAGPVVEDDCAVARAGTLHGLFPTAHELRWGWTAPLVAVAVLTDQVEGPVEVTAAEAGALAASIQVPWPARWLPFGAARPAHPADFGAARCLLLPPRCDRDEASITAVARLAAGS